MLVKCWRKSCRCCVNDASKASALPCFLERIAGQCRVAFERIAAVRPSTRTFRAAPQTGRLRCCRGTPSPPCRRSATTRRRVQHSTAQRGCDRAKKIANRLLANRYIKSSPCLQGRLMPIPYHGMAWDWYYIRIHGSTMHDEGIFRQCIHRSHRCRHDQALIRKSIAWRCRGNHERPAALRWLVRPLIAAFKFSESQLHC